MTQTTTSNQIVYTNKARCRDCNRCVRVCPVKAIRMEDGQASVCAERCIACGTCIRECPQHAKSYRNDIARARELLLSGDPVAASIAPSFAARYEDWAQTRLPSALRQLGFCHIGETAVGAPHVAEKTAAYAATHKEESHICSSCPAVVRYVELYAPKKVRSLVPLPSPMIVHASHLKASCENMRVVFIGPCVAKKAEAERPEYDGVVDCVLTFAELEEWLLEDGIDMQRLEESGFDESASSAARYFPVTGGSLHTANLSTDMLEATLLAVSGVVDLQEALDTLDERQTPLLIEPLFCREGCINGPVMQDNRHLFSRKQELLRFAQLESNGCHALDAPSPSPTPCFHADEKEDVILISEESILRVLEKTGKASTEDQLNCGACGYESCREKAIAVLRGLAEPEMCIPYMRRLAEQRGDKIIDTTPNGIVIVDQNLEILSMNPAFRKFFSANERVVGKPIGYLMDPDPFERLLAGVEERFEEVVRHERYNLICHQILYRLPEEKQIVGLFVDITGLRSSQEKLDHLRAETALQAQELLEHQIAMAQQMAKYLGESTARGEVLVSNLLRLTNTESARHPDGQDSWLKSTYISK